MAGLTVGFIGLGAMGTPIVRNLLSAGIRVRVYNRTADTIQRVAAALPPDHQPMFTAALSAKDAAPDQAGIVVSIVSNDAALEAVVTDENGVLAGLGSGGVHLCLSTVAPATTDKMADLHAAKGVAYVACSVFGRPEAAAAKKLIAVPAGEAAAVERIIPIIQATAQKIVRAGPKPSSASVLKLCGNYMILSAIEMCAESFALAESSGIDRETAYDLLAGPTGLFATLPILQGYGRMVAKQEYTPVGFTACNGLKDAKLVCDAAHANGVEMPIAELVKGRLEKVAAEPGGGDRDWASFAAQVHVPIPAAKPQ